ncbi:hypothetical protein Syun_003357 [Stephania yunnanensis]|uniref:Myb/SANT-like domain-containing protein n=1 Tax=Stephania yunnanensis TaxID=152371 RepID=A0AAP0L220_9MAGN
MTAWIRSCLKLFWKSTNLAMLQIIHGNLNSWKPEVYTRVCLELLKQLKQQVHPVNVKARIKTLKANYFSAREVIFQSGIGWDPDTQFATADVLTWKEYLQKHPEKESYRTKCVPYYDELCVIFGYDQATEGMQLLVTRQT